MVVVAAVIAAIFVDTDTNATALAPGYALAAGAAVIAANGFAAYMMSLAARLSALETGVGSTAFKAIWDKCEQIRASTAAAAARFDWSRAGHIFRDADGHVNPGSQGSQARFAQIFESVASNPANLRPDAVENGIITEAAPNNGVQAFTVFARSGEQVWVTVRNGLIQNAGVNLPGAGR